MSIINNDLLLGSGDEGYNLTRSLRFRSSASAYLNRTQSNSSGGNKWTFSTWFKRGTLGTNTKLIGTSSGVGSTNALAEIYLDTSDRLVFFQYNSGTTYTNLVTTQVFRDPSAWYHIIVSYDDTQATSTNRVKFYVNGVQVTAFSTASYPSQNFTSFFNTSSNPVWIGVYTGNSYYLDGYLAEINFVDGQSLTESSFGSTNTLTGVWQPARYGGTYGTNGFYLPFTDNSALTTSSNVGLGKDFSGNGNYWTTNNISITAGVTYDSMTDVPTLTSATAANFSTLNPLKNVTTLSNANLTFSGQSNSVRYSTGTIAVTSGKYYFEAVASVFAPGSAVIGFGVAKTSVDISSPSTSDVYIYNNNGTKYGGGSGSAAYGASFAVGDIVGVALDMDNGTLTFYKNNVSQGTAFTGLTGQTITASLYSYGDVSVFSAGSINFGQRPFAYTPPTGFVALNTYNLPTSTIVKGNTVMDATLWTGNNSTNAIVNAAGFKPDLIWIKDRSRAGSHVLVDSVRGITKALSSDGTWSENTYSFSQMSSINSNGFTLTANTTSDNFYVNVNADTFVGWQWQAGQGTTSTNTNGTITSTVSVNASAGFSVVTYTGTGANATVGHGLGVAPAMYIVKRRNGAIDWGVYHSSLTSPAYGLYLNTNNAQFSAPTYWNSTAPTSSVFSIGTDSLVNASGATMVAYCFAPIAGYSAFGKWQNNNSTDGTFTYLGFTPKFLLMKEIDAGEQWYLIDTARFTFNVAPPAGSKFLSPASSSAEFGPSTATVDLLSNGFKIRTTNPASGELSFGTRNYIYMAFAEVPFKHSLAR